MYCSSLVGHFSFCSPAMHHGFSDGALHFGDFLTCDLALHCAPIAALCMEYKDSNSADDCITSRRPEGDCAAFRQQCGGAVQPSLSPYGLPGAGFDRGSSRPASTIHRAAHLRLPCFPAPSKHAVAAKEGHSGHPIRTTSSAEGSKHHRGHRSGPRVQRSCCDG